jgi:hypothetical protein
MATRTGWLVAIGIIATATPPGPGAPLPTPAWRNPAVSAWTNGAQAEVVGCRWTFFRTDETCVTWFLRAGGSDLKAGFRGDCHLGNGWRINADFGAGLLTGLAVTARVEWHPVEGIMLAAEWGRTALQVAWWIGSDWDLAGP